MRKQILKFVKQKYNICEEYLWDKFPNYCVFRNTKNKKWFGIIMNVSSQKIGINKDENIDILVVKCEPVLRDLLLTKSGYYHAYHLNKNGWITLILDGTLNLNEITKMIEYSYELVNNPKKT